MLRSILLALVLLLPLAAHSQQAEIALARQYLDQNARAFAVPENAAGQARVTAAYTSPGTGLTHVYFRQTIDGIDVRGGDITVTLRPDGRVVHAAGSFHYAIDRVRGAAPGLAAEDAARTVAQHVGVDLPGALELAQAPRGDDRATVLTAEALSEPIEARLIFEPQGDELRLAWDVMFHEPADPHVWSVRVDAATGEVLGQNDYVVHDHWGKGPSGAFGRDALRSSPAAPEVGWQAPAPLERPEAAASGAAPGPIYMVYPYPLESPNHGFRMPAVNPADPLASPFGWHDVDGTVEPNYTITRGNNVFAYVDANNSNQPNGADAVPDGGEDLIFDFPINFSQHPQTYRLAAVTNLFYWNNLIHDVLWHYGFDEPAGNFQQFNYGGQGAGNDAVRAEAQDGGGTNNANFFTPVDGQAPRMQMYLWNLHGSPPIDGDFDNGIIAHEYAHGWSIRLTGGPNNVQCLWNQEQMGEGWSDYLGLILTMRPNDHAEQVRGIGTFALNQPINGGGIRPAPYSTSMAVNGYTYGNIPSLSVPHGVGFVWATMLWEMTWKLVDVYGFDLDIVNGSGGNNVALRLVSEAMKLQPCSPGFVDGRDAILAADQALYDGAHALQIWQAFAKRGLGYSASQGSSGSSNDGVEAFDLPPGMDRSLTMTSEPAMVPAGEFLTYTLEFINGIALDPVTGVTVAAELPEGLIYAPGSASHGGHFDPDSRILHFPVGDVDTGETISRSFNVVADIEGGSTLLFEDDMNEGTDGWEVGHGTGNVTWSQVAESGVGGGTAWYARNMPNPSDQYLILEDALVPTGGTLLTFRHRYHTEPRWDGGVVEISVDDGPWQDLGEFMLTNGYNDVLRTTATGNPLAGRPAFTGNSSGYITTDVDLAGFAGESIRIRFRLGTDSIVGYPNFDGWYVDEVVIIDEVAVTASACGEAAGQGLGCASVKTMVLDPLEGAPQMAHDLDELVFAIPPDSFDEVTLTFSNLGDRDLMVIAGIVGLEDVIAVTGGMLEVEPGADQEITITINTDEAASGWRDGELVLVSNDPEAPIEIVPITLHISGVGDESMVDALPDGFLLGSVYPNPFAHAAHLTLRVAEDQDVTIVLYDVMGRQVVRLHEGTVPAGPEHRFTLDGSGLASGVYILGVRGEHFSTTQRITRLR